MTKIALPCLALPCLALPCLALPCKILGRLCCVWFIYLIAGCAAIPPSAVFSNSKAAVPNVGSAWVSQTIYVDSGRKKNIETMHVSKLHETTGTPVVVGETFGYKGMMIEAEEAILLITDDCYTSVPKELFAPPKYPNQCGWHICTAPKIGTLYQKKWLSFISMNGCMPKQGLYTFTSKGNAVVNNLPVTVGDASLSFGLFSKFSWESHIQNGIGEVFGKSAGRETIYLPTQKVSLTPYVYKEHAAHKEQMVSEATQKPPLTLSSVEVDANDCRIIAFGDSLTEGMGVKKEESYPAVLAVLAGRKICNRGMSGNTTEVALQRVDEVIALKPTLTIVILGANDILQNIDVESSYKNLRKIVQKFKAAGMAIALGGIKTEGADVPLHIKRMADATEKVAQEEEIYLMPHIFEGILGRTELLASDGMHLNKDGYKKLAKNVNEQLFIVIDDLLKTIPAIKRQGQHQ